MTETKNVLITGASAGIGKRLALEYASYGHNLVLLSRKLDLLANLKDEIEKSYKVRVFIKGVDVASEAGLKEAVSEAIAEIGEIDTVIANAGFGVGGTFETLNTADYHRQFSVNIFGTINTIYASLESLKKSKGRLCLIGSGSSYLTAPGTTAYSMSKYAIRSLAEGLYAELATKGVSVTLIIPGFIKTNIRKTDNNGVFRNDLSDPVPEWLMMSSEKAAKKIYRAVLLGKRELTLTGHAYIGVWLARYFPGILAFLFKTSFSQKRSSK